MLVSEIASRNSDYWRMLNERLLRRITRAHANSTVSGAKGSRAEEKKEGMVEEVAPSLLGRLYEKNDKKCNAKQ